MLEKESKAHREGWADNSHKLGSLVLTHLANRTDCYGKYVPNPICVKENLASTELIQHFRLGQTLGLCSSTWPLSPDQVRNISP